MSSLPTRTEEPANEDFNKIPVFYCRECLSLRIMRVANMDDACYCDECGSADIVESTIEEWEALYEKRYGFKYLNKDY